jgi:pimeloyl-ACP methyl ester carboxylesterase
MWSLCKILLISLADDGAATKRIIELQDGPVILVGHSYAGVVITEAGNDPKVVGLVYVAVFAPGEGESINSVSKPYPPAPLGGELRLDARGFLTATRKGIAEDMAQDLPDVQQQILTATQGQTAAAVFGATVTTAAWKSKPSWAVIAGNDRAIPPELEKDEAATIKATSITLPANHLAMLSHPREVAEDHLAFYPHRVDGCYVDGERVHAQEGDFYGGWITANIVGPFKGRPRTFGW